MSVMLSFIAEDSSGWSWSWEHDGVEKGRAHVWNKTAVRVVGEDFKCSQTRTPSVQYRIPKVTGGGRGGVAHEWRLWAGNDICRLGGNMWPSLTTLPRMIVELRQSQIRSFRETNDELRPNERPVLIWVSFTSRNIVMSDLRALNNRKHVWYLSWCGWRGTWNILSIMKSSSNLPSKVEPLADVKTAGPCFLFLSQ